MQNLQKQSWARSGKHFQVGHWENIVLSYLVPSCRMYIICIIFLSLSKNLSVWMDVYAWWQNGVVFQQRQVACRKCKRSMLDGWMMALVFSFGEKMTWIYRISWLKDKTFRRISRLPLAWLILIHRYFLRWIAMKNATIQLSNAHSIFNILSLPWGKGFN